MHVPTDQAARLRACDPGHIFSLEHVYKTDILVETGTANQDKLGQSTLATPVLSNCPPGNVFLVRQEQRNGLAGPRASGKPPDQPPDSRLLSTLLTRECYVGFERWPRPADRIGAFRT
jgi:hypothetical protein